MYDVIIIGAGPSGLTAAIYTSRNKSKTLIVTGSLLGGQISLTYEIDNYPGFYEYISGPELIDRFQSHALKYGAEFLNGSVTKVDFKKSPYKIWVDNQDYEAHTVIIASGMSHKKLGVEGEDRLMGHGVFVCATCDAIFYEDRKVVVIGGGDSAVQEALDLSKFASEVIIVHRRNELKACRYLSDRARENPRIRFILNTAVKEIIGDKKVEAIILQDIATNSINRIETDGVLIAIGWNPNTSIFRGEIDMDEEGYITHNGVKTNLEGIYVAGDLIDKRYNQVITSCASGCAAALEAISWIQEKS